VHKLNQILWYKMILKPKLTKNGTRHMA